LRIEIISPDPNVIRGDDLKRGLDHLLIRMKIIEMLYR